MRLLSIALKNIAGNWWRSLSLGLFVFLTSFILIVFNSLFMTVTGNMQDALINSLTGHVQIRSEFTEEEDMLAMKTSWTELHFLSCSDLEGITAVLNSKRLDYTQRVRTNATLIKGVEQDYAMIIGHDPKEAHYRLAFGLEQGRYLSPSATGEVVLASYFAEQLQISVGETIQAVSEAGSVSLTVVGIGDVQMLSMFGYNAVFTDLESARVLAGYESGEATDVIVFVPESDQTKEVFTQLDAELQGVTLSVWEDMGGFVFNGISVYQGMGFIFILVLMVIVSILIINLVFMMGMERRQEIGTLKAIGYSRKDIIQIFLGEILIIAVAFCSLGIAAGSGLVLALSNIGFEFGPPIDFMMGKVFYIQYDFKLIFPMAAIVLLFTLVAALWPSWHAATLDPVKTLRD
ncbi:MAG TPA: hypothetical protein DG577_10420 [Firmicutes bacterium]|jgi:putative ABC transport system permease protein|nr:hypothetical protein [Bacillota bacterium]HCX79815.1 hypothetical protein [Bacillota bacterium]